MKRPALLHLAIICLVLSSCTRYAYYQSPMHTNNTTYKSMPLVSDNLKQAVYASGTFSTGGANQNQQDGFNLFIGSIYQTRQFGKFQAFYGATGSVGNYHVKPYNFVRGPVGTTIPNRNHNLNDSLIDVMSGGKFFGSWGFTGGMNFVLPFNNRKGGEWRIIGTEFCWQQEYGNYLKFRQALPDTAANLNDRHRDYFTIALTTEFIGKTRRGSTGVKFANVLGTRSLTRYGTDRKSYKLAPGYFSITYQLTIDRITGLTQINFGTYAANFQLGCNIRL